MYTYIYTHTHTFPYRYMQTYVKTPCILLKLKTGAELNKVRIKQQKSLFHYQHKISRHALTTFDYHQNIFMKESWNAKLRSV